MSGVFDGESWKHADDKPRPAAVNLQIRTRADQQAWLDQQYLRRQIGLKEWRFHTDIVSLQNSDGSFLENP
jgi:hypothetical protein